MNVEICFLTNACQAGLPNLTKFNQTVHLADESKRREREREKERERRLHASFRVGHHAVTAITENNMQHSQRATKTQASLTTFQVQREDNSDSERHSIRSEIHKVFFVCLFRSDPRQCQCLES